MFPQGHRAAHRLHNLCRVPCGELPQSLLYTGHQLPVVQQAPHFVLPNEHRGPGHRRALHRRRLPLRCSKFEWLKRSQARAAFKSSSCSEGRFCLTARLSSAFQNNSLSNFLDNIYLYIYLPKSSHDTGHLFCVFWKKFNMLKSTLWFGGEICKYSCTV